MTSETTGKVRLIITWLLRALLGLAFLAIGIEKLTGTMGTIPFFNAIGWGRSSELAEVDICFFDVRHKSCSVPPVTWLQTGKI